jgi:hypothetical protein
MPTPAEWTERLGLEPNEVIPIGRLRSANFATVPRISRRAQACVLDRVSAHQHPFEESYGVLQLLVAEDQDREQLTKDTDRGRAVAG